MITIGSLCSGAGMLDMAAEQLTGGRVAWVCETDPDASLVLAARVGVSNHGDITAIDWNSVEPVDVVTAGYPCTDLSNAGKRAGIEGVHSGIWRNVADAVRVLRPRLVLLENVRAHLARGFGRVLGDLADLGYDADWTCLRASDVGAPHQRDRVFIAAAPAHSDREPVRLEHVGIGARLAAAQPRNDRPGDDGLSLLPPPSASRGRGQSSPMLAAKRLADGRRNLDDAVALLPTPAARDSGRGSGYTDEPGRPLSETVMRLLPTPRATEGTKGGPHQRGSAGALTSSVMLLPTPTATDARGGRNATSGRQPGSGHHDGWTLSDVAYADRWAQYGPAIRRWETILGRPAPEPTITGSRGGQRLSAVFVEWLMGLPQGWVTDLVDNNAALRILGNGVVPQQAVAAYRSLADHIRATPPTKELSTR